MDNFLGSPAYNYLISTAAFVVFLLEYKFSVERNRLLVLLPKVVFYQAFLLELIVLKYKQHRNSLTQAQINLSLRNSIVHVIFGIFNYSKHSHIIHSCWFILDTLKFIHILFNNKITAFLKYFTSIPLFVIHGFYECLDIVQVSAKYHIFYRACFIFYLLFHATSLELVLKYKVLQLLWYRKNKREQALLKKNN